MVIIETDDGAICIGQASHSWVSGRLARAWGNDRFAVPEPFDDVCLGAGQHDIGMAEWDLAPTLDRDTGLPCSFLNMPLATHLELWSRAPAKVLTQSPYAALLVSMHGHALYARNDTLEPDTDDSRAVRRFVQEREAFQRELMAALDEPEDRAKRNQVLVWALDFLSLAPLAGWVPDSVPAPTHPDEPDAELQVESAGPRAVTVDPWPFATDELTLHYHGRRLRGTYEDEPALHRALQEAPWETLEVTWARGDDAPAGATRHNARRDHAAD